MDGDERAPLMSEADGGTDAPPVAARGEPPAFSAAAAGDTRAAERAAEYLEKFSLWLELPLAHRVKAKVGSAGKGFHNSAGVGRSTVDNKKVAPLYKKQKNNFVEATLGFSPTQEQENALRNVFVHYCGYLEKDNYTHMRRGQFLKFARDSNLCNDTMDLIEINLLFTKINSRSSAAGENELSLTFQEWLIALSHIASAENPQVASVEAFTLLAKYVVDHADSVPVKDPLGDAIYTPQVFRVLERYRPAIKRVYNYYCSVEELKAAKGSVLRWEDITHTRNTVSQREWQSFVADFDIIPELLTKAEVARAFRQANFGKFGSADQNRLSFYEFEDALCRCACIAYGLARSLGDTDSRRRAKKVRTVQTTTFTGDYASGAKELWAAIEPATLAPTVIPPVTPRGGNHVTAQAAGADGGLQGDGEEVKRRVDDRGGGSAGSSRDAAKATNATLRRSGGASQCPPPPQSRCATAPGQLRAAAGRRRVDAHRSEGPKGAQPWVAKDSTRLYYPFAGWPPIYDRRMNRLMSERTLREANSEAERRRAVCGRTLAGRASLASKTASRRHLEERSGMLPSLTTGERSAFGSPCPALVQSLPLSPTGPLSPTARDGALEFSSGLHSQITSPQGEAFPFHFATLQRRRRAAVA